MWCAQLNIHPGRAVPHRRHAGGCGTPLHFCCCCCVKARGARDLSRLERGAKRLQRAQGAGALGGSLDAEACGVWRREISRTWA